MLHRDLKPANVLGCEGRWQLADFGIARVLAEATGTYTFRGAGTVPYMAPELWRGSPASVKTDLYALGIIAYESVVGSRPFNGPTEDDYRRQHLSEPPPSLGSTPPGVARLVLRLLAKDPAERPQDARDVVERLVLAIKPLSPPQHALREAALDAASRRATAEATKAVEEAAAEAEAQARRQAIADLRQVLVDAQDSAQEALSEVALGEGRDGWNLVFELALVGITLWEEAPRADLPEGDPIVLAGLVYTVAADGVRLEGNVVCERHGERLVWSYLRFRANAIVGSRYAYGPLERAHGFERAIFAQERPYMVRTGGHVWVMEKTTPLRPEAFTQLLADAIRRM